MSSIIVSPLIAPSLVGQALGIDPKRGNPNILLFCVDWANGWLRFLSEPEVSRLAPPSMGGIKKCISVPHMMGEENTWVTCVTCV